MTEGRIRILHLSDFHFADPSLLARPSDFFRAAAQRTQGIADMDIAEAVARDAFLRRDDLDGILITGDMAATGSLADLSRAVEFVGTSSHTGWLSSRQQPTLAACALPIIVLPGNHDRFVGIMGDPGGTAFDDVFSDFWRAGQGVDVFEIGKPGGGLAVVGADLSLREKAHCDCLLGHLGQGRAYSDAVNNMCDATRAVRQENPRAAVVWAVHFPPFYPERDQSMELIDGVSVLRAARDVGVDYVFCGHRHERMRPPVESCCGVNVVCAGSATQKRFRQENWAHVVEFRLANARVVGIEFEDYRWDARNANFILT